MNDIDKEIDSNIEDTMSEIEEKVDELMDLRNELKKLKIAKTCEHEWIDTPFNFAGKTYKFKKCIKCEFEIDA